LRSHDECAKQLEPTRADLAKAVELTTCQPQAVDMTAWIQGGEVLQLPVGDGEHHVLFNPLGSGGVTVVDKSARSILEGFRQPTTKAAALRNWAGSNGEFRRVFGELTRFGMLHPAGQPPRRPDFGRSEVLTAWLHVTNACNLDCPYCYLDKNGEPMTEETGRAAVEAVFRSAVDHGFKGVKLKYAGGEASLNHKLVLLLHDYAVELAKKHGVQLYATLLSNGTALPKWLIQSLKARDIKVMVSLDGIGEMHDAVRKTKSGQPTFRIVERTIGRLLELGHAPHLSITITARNAPGLADVVQWALERDLSFSLNLFRDNDCAASFSDLQFEEQAMIEALLAGFQVIEEIMPAWSVLGLILDRGQLLQPRQRACGVGEDYVVIDQKGGVASCHMEIEKTLGDVFRDDPLELVRHSPLRTLNIISDEKEGCRDCPWRYWCTGGCSVATFRATGRFDIKSPNCHIYKAIYPAALRLEGLRLLKYATPAIASQ